MHILLVIFFTLFSFSCSETMEKRVVNTVLDSTVPTRTCPLNDCSNYKIDVSLRDPEMLFEGARSLKDINTGFVEILLPNFGKTKLLCFSENPEEYKQAQTLSHVICRQLGFKAATNINSILLPSSVYYKNYNGLKPNSFICKGHEQNIAQCKWKSTTIERCRAATELSCGVDASSSDNPALFNEPISSENVNGSLSHTKFVTISLPTDPKTNLLCFPKTTGEYIQAYTLSHVICRQMRFMTATSINGVNISSLDEYQDNYGVKPDTYSCAGTEQNISQCSWENATVERCSVVTELTCGDCHYKIKAASGFIDIPGYHLVDLYGITCEWEFVIPNNTVTLSFHQFQSLFKKSSPTSCSLQDPYMDILYTEQDEMKFDRYCNLQDLKNLTFSRGVRIRIFTGFHQPEETKLDWKKSYERGVGISFFSGPLEKARDWLTIGLMLLTLSFAALNFMFFGIAISAIFCKKRSYFHVWFGK